MDRLRVGAYLPLLLLLVMFSSCSKKYRIDGSSSVTGFDGKMLYLKVLQGEEWVSVDSAEVVHGLFQMKGAADSVRMATLYMNEEGLMPVVLEEGKITISIANTGLTAKGTSLNDKLYEFIDTRNRFETKLGELERKEAQMVLDGADVDEVQAQLSAEGEKLMKEMHEYNVKFIKDNYENVLGPGVFMMMCSILPYPMMTPRVEDVMRTAPSSFKENAMVKDFLTKAKENMKLIEEHQRMQENQIVEANKNRGK